MLIVMLTNDRRDDCVLTEDIQAKYQGVGILLSHTFGPLWLTVKRCLKVKLDCSKLFTGFDITEVNLKKDKLWCSLFHPY